MTDKHAEPIDENEELRPIPDGGLSTSLPPWLKEPPAWSQHHEEAETVVPAADESPIDPRDLVSADDLPAWLQAISRRSTAGLPNLADEPEPTAEAEFEVPEPESESKETLPVHTPTVPVVPDRAAEQTPRPGKPEWMLGPAAQRPVVPIAEDDMQRWLAEGEPVSRKRKLVSDPMLLLFIIAAIAIVAVAAYLLTHKT